MRLPRVSRRWGICLAVVVLGACVASANWATELVAERETAKRIVGVWKTAPGDRGPAVWWFRDDGTFTAWTEDAAGMRVSEHGRWWLSGERLLLECMLPPKESTGPGCRLDQMMVVRADAFQMVLAGWSGESLVLKRR